MECLTAHHWMYELNALSLEILSLIQNDNNLQKEFRLECSGQLPDLFVQSHRIIWGYLFICFLSTCTNRQEICPDCILSVKIFFPTNAFCLTTCRFFVNNSSRKKCQMNVTLWLKLCESQQVLFNGMSARTVLVWVWLAYIEASWATGSNKSAKPTSDLPIYSGFMLNHRKHSAFISENKKAWLTPNFLPALWHF